VPNAIGGFDSLVRNIAQVEVVDASTLHITTKTTSPGLPGDLSFISIVSSHVGKDATTADYNSGRADIGSGPYKFVSYQPGDKLLLARNEAWWGPKPQWDKVSFAMIANIAARTASLLAGDTDLIEAPSASDLPKLREDPHVAIFAVPGGRVSYINPILDPAADVPPITDRNGKPYPVTPLRDVRVRHALSIAINRRAITERVMMGTGTPAGQWLPKGSYSYAPDVGVPDFDPAAAKALLAEAGYPDGFRMILSTANDRTPYSVEIAQAVAQMWTRIGVVTTVDAMPFAVYSPRGAKREFQAYFGSLGNPSMEAGLLLRSLLMTADPTTGAGTYNWSGYSNPALDALTNRAMATVDDGAREKLLIEAVAMTAKDVPFMPIYQFQSIWAARDGITYEARADEMTLAMGAHPVTGK
jgi:peptide/nickel transport system substrate-binding protein